MSNAFSHKSHANESEIILVACKHQLI